MCPERALRITRMSRSRILLFEIVVCAVLWTLVSAAGTELSTTATPTGTVEQNAGVAGYAALPLGYAEERRQSFTFSGTTQPIEFEVYDERSERMENGLGYPALSPGNLTFLDARDHDRWSDPTRILHFSRGELIATIDDPDLDAQLAAERGQLAPLWAEYSAMLRVSTENPEAMSGLLLVLKEGEALQREAAVLEKEAERALKRAVVAPADAEIIEGTRQSANINPMSGDLFRYYPLSHVRCQVRVPLTAWGPDWRMDLRIDGRPARILRIRSVDLDETNEEWILGIEFKPARSFECMSQDFDYELVTTTPVIQRLSEGLRLHRPSCALIGRRRTYPSTAPKIPGLLFFSKEENCWVNKDETIGGVTLSGMADLLEKVRQYRVRTDKFLKEVEDKFIPAGIMAKNDHRLVHLRQYHAEAGRFVERASAMTVEAKESGLLVGTLDYQGPLTSANADLPARVKSPYVEIPDVLVGKDIDVKDEDVVFVELPSGAEKLAKVLKVVPETMGSIQDLRGNKLISVLVYSVEFHLGEHSASGSHGSQASARESGMPAYVRIPMYSDQAERTRIQSQLKSDFEGAKTRLPPDVPLYPIRFTFKNSTLSPLEKMAYMRRANSAPGTDPGAAPSYLDLLTSAIIQEQDPENRWIAFRRLIDLRFTAGFDPFVQIALQGHPDVASGALFHLNEKRREFELFDILGRLQSESETWDAETRQQKLPLLSLTYQLLRGQIDHPNLQCDALDHLIKKGRLDPVFWRRIEDFFFLVIRSEGVNAPASIRILRGADRTGQLFFSDHALQTAANRAESGGDSCLSRVFLRELERRELMGISENSKYGYGAAFIETGFLFLRDLEMIDALVRSRENYLHDLRFLESSPHWADVFPLDPEVLASLRERRKLTRPVPAPEWVPAPNADCLRFGQDIEFSAFRHLTKPDRCQLINDLGDKQDYSTLVLLLRDPFIRRHNAGDILDWLLLTPEARLEVARYCPHCTDSGLLDLIERRQFAVGVLSDIDQTVRLLERMSLSAARPRNPPSGEPVNPAVIYIYQQLLLHLWERTSNEESRFNYLVTWAGLLPSGFELGDDLAALRGPVRDRGIAEDDLGSALRYVRERRALEHAVERQREKRAENRQVEIHPGQEETVLRQIAQTVEAGMPPRRYPLELLEEQIDTDSTESTADRSQLALRDTLRLVRVREREFATGKRERLRFEDIAAYAARVVLAPLYLLALIPLIWIAKLAMISAGLLRFRSSYSPSYFRSNIRRAGKLLKSIEDDSPLKKEISRWIRILESEQLNVDRLVRLQERVKRIMNFRDLVYHVPANGKCNARKQGHNQQASRQDPLHLDVTVKLAPCLTLLALLCRLTAERIWTEAGQDGREKQRKYLLVEWFLQRSAYFSGYRYTLNPLANHQIAENYIWQDIPFIESRGQSAVLWILLFPLNILIGTVNGFGHVFLSLPMRFVYLFTPISLLGAAVFKWSLRRFVIDAGNALEACLYPDPAALMKATREKLRTGWVRRAYQPDQPGGRFFFSFRRVATRVLPFVIVMTIVSGGFPYVYEMLVGDTWANGWNIRSTGIYAAFAALVVLTLTMVLHWLPLLMGWIPFAHLSNLSKASLLRRRIRRTSSTEAGSVICGAADAGEALRQLSFEDALAALRAEKDSDAPILDVLILMVEDPNLLDRYREMAKSLVSHRTVVLAYRTGEFMDGGGARLSTLKTIHETYPEIRMRHPHLPIRFDQTRSAFIPIGSDCDPTIGLPLEMVGPTGSTGGSETPLTPFILVMANVQSLMRQSFVYEEEGTTNRFVGSITASPQRIYVGPHNVDQGGKFRGGITLVGAFESIHTAGRRGALVIMGNHAFIRNSPNQLRDIIQNDPTLCQWLDPLNAEKRQLPVAQLVIERFRTSERYGRHVVTCVRYIDEIQKIKEELLAQGPLGERDVSDMDFLNNIAIHYMRHLIVPWFLAFQGGSLESYRSSVLTGDLPVRDRRRAFHQRVLELVELIQEEGQTGLRQLPKVRFVSAPFTRVHFAKTIQDTESIWTNPRLVFFGKQSISENADRGRDTTSKWNRADEAKPARTSLRPLS